VQILSWFRNQNCIRSANCYYWRVVRLSLLCIDSWETDILNDQIIGGDCALSKPCIFIKAINRFSQSMQWIHPDKLPSCINVIPVISKLSCFYNTSFSGSRSHLRLYCAWILFISNQIWTLFLMSQKLIT